MIYRLANELRLEGYVKNGSDGVHIFFNASEEAADFFFKKIKQEKPEQAKITLASLQKIEKKLFTDFSIKWEHTAPEINVLISPDRAICKDCLEELQDKSNRRYRYPFITCTSCGPRYSIIHKLPYDRQYTSMEHFEMCEECYSEYYDVPDKRCFSQTNSCTTCGIELSINDGGSFYLSGNSEDILSAIKKFLQQGKILAVKGIGGYLLLAGANNPEAIRLLRDRKHRPSKPLAVLYPDVESVQQHFELSRQERKLLESAEAPIMLLYPKQEALNNLAVPAIAPGLNRLGIMLPYNPLLQLIATDYGKPLIATSANISGSPIIYKDEDAITYLFGIADYSISYNRDIVIPQDDSVLQVSKYSGQPIILRRSRGYAPSFLHYKPKSPGCVLSTGAFLKSSFTLSVNGNVFVSQFLGSGESYESQQMYKDTLEHWTKLYPVKPGIILTDMHPNYFSNQYAIELAEKYHVDTKLVQHHEAHFAAVLAENELLYSSKPVLGVIWDGTGLGRDGNIWGGEFFKYENNEMLRCYHFDYFPAIAGDKLASEPRIAALCATSHAWPQPGKVREKFTDTEWSNYQALINNTMLFTSSVGRLFDAVASLLNVCDKQSYEGEAALRLQVLAEEYVTKKGFVMNESYFKEESHYYRIPTASLMQEIIMDIKKDRDKSYIAAKFHFSLVCLIDIVAKNIEVENICFSGGVFQNALLVDWIQSRYLGKYSLFFHKDLSPNDENISFGQLIYHDNQIKSILKEDSIDKARTNSLEISAIHNS
jgi:hydrogenase maturation protein HypF